MWEYIGNGLNQEHGLLPQPKTRETTKLGGWDVRSAQILCVLKWESLADRRAKQQKSLKFITANNLVPEYLSDKFTCVNLPYSKMAAILVLLCLLAN